ncbi:MAG TPA: hypothetical protein VET30_04140 [Pseudoxanthomonas sp.]|nr:hypothetical protein [Pseudoxanthomonas sp.]
MEPLSDRADAMFPASGKSVAHMVHLVHDVLDFARGRLGGGIPVSLYADHALVEELRQVVDEVRTASPDSDITADVDIDVDIDCEVTCDRQRMA